MNNVDDYLITCRQIDRGYGQICEAAIEKCPEDDYAPNNIADFEVIRYYKKDGNQSDETILKKYKGNDKIVVVPDGITDIGVKAFSSNGDIAQVILPESVVDICSYAFDSCINLESVKLGNNIRHIGCLTFNNCKSLATITIPDTVEDIDSYAFSFCTNLQQIALPVTTKHIRKNAFLGCSNLKKIYLSIHTELHDTTRNNLEDVEKIYYENSSSYYDYQVTSGKIIHYKGLQIITIPDYVTEIGAHAFEGCNFIQEVIIPPTVTVIEDSAFKDCSNLQIVRMQPNLGRANRVNDLKVASNAFAGCHPRIRFMVCDDYVKNASELLCKGYTETNNRTDKVLSGIITRENIESIDF